jgi:hypothetical protein
MKNLSPHTRELAPQTVPQGDEQVPAYLAPQPHKESVLLRWWYRIASPIEPDRSASFEEMERFRRGRLGSQVILALYILLVIAIPAAFIGTNIYLIPIVIGSALALLVAIVLNRLGMVNIAGGIVVLTFIAFPTVNIVTTPGGLSMEVLPLYALLALPLLCAVSFLSPWWVFVVAFGNILFVFLSLTELHRTAELNTLLAVAFWGIVTPIILIMLLVAIVAYALAQGTIHALQRASNAEELARLEFALSTQAEKELKQKQQLEASIQAIVQTHMRVANGDYNARVPLEQENVLWNIAGSLNNLLARLQSSRARESRLEEENRLLRNAYENLDRVRGNSGQENGN